jgi:hypothetical protein
MKIQRIATKFLLCTCFVSASSALAQPEDPTPFAGPTPLTLINGWTNAPSFGTTAVSSIGNDRQDVDCGCQI